MSKFKVGDRVKLVEGTGSYSEHRFAGRTGTVVDVEDGMAEADFGGDFDGHNGSQEDPDATTRWYIDEEDMFEVVVRAVPSETTPSTADTEIEAMKTVAAAYETLDDDALERVHAYISNRFGLNY